MASADTTLARRVRGVPVTLSWSWQSLPVAWLVLVLVASFVVPAISPYDSTGTSAEVLKSPSPSHPFGTDNLGRDVLVRVSIAGRTSLWIALGAVLVGTAGGILLGALAAVRGRWTTTLIMRSMDVLLAFPAIILALVLALMLGKGTGPVVLVIGIVLVPQVVRLVRARLVSELEREYVMAARGAGASTWRIIRYHVARNVSGPVIAFATVALADAVMFEAALSFLGLGVQPPNPSLGNMLAEGQAVLLAGAWWVSVFPGLVLFLTLIALNSLVDRARAREATELSRVRA
jgi:peptide/nickel transport system permease protein